MYYADRNYASTSLSPPSSPMVTIAGGAATDSADPELIVSIDFNKATDEIRLGSCMGRLRARNASISHIQGEVFLFPKLNNAGCRFK
jgi:hypothetical protein